jgi:SagB-type dehydrogenase family enzyme
MITLPQPLTDGTVPLEAAIARRRSVRSFRDEPLSPQELSQLLWAAQGVTGRRGFRAVPSAGATFPLETYVADPDGVFRYHPGAHALEPCREGDPRGMLSLAALGQPFVRQAPLTIAFSAVPERTTGRYGSRGLTYIHMEAGHAAQNVHLQAVALGLESVAVGAFQDHDVAAVLGLPDEEIPLYLVCVGRKA